MISKLPDRHFFGGFSLQNKGELKMATNIKVPSKNLTALIISLAALGVAEYCYLPNLFYFGMVMSAISSVLAAISLIAYTITIVKIGIKNV